MGKAEYQPQPFTDAKRRGVAVTVRGTANIAKQLITMNLDQGIIKELQEPNMAGYPEQELIASAREDFVKGFKKLRKLEKMLDDRG